MRRGGRMYSGQPPSEAGFPAHLSKFLGELPSLPGEVYYQGKNMSEQVSQSPIHRSVSTRTILLAVLLVGLGAGAVGYGLNNAFASRSPSQQTTALNNQWSGLRGSGPPGWFKDGGSILTLRAASTVANVSATGFSITDSTHFTITIAYHGTGSAPAVTIVGLAPGLSGSATVVSGWTSPKTVSITLVGTGSLTNTPNVRALIVPLTS